MVSHKGKKLKPTHLVVVDDMPNGWKVEAWYATEDEADHAANKLKGVSMKNRPNVDDRNYIAAEDLLNTSDVFQALDEDAQEDRVWELADRIQKQWEAYCEEQKF